MTAKNSDALSYVAKLSNTHAIIFSCHIIFD